MRTLRVVGLFLTAALLFFSTQAGAAKPQPNRVKHTAEPIATLALDGVRVAYVSEGRVHVWNVLTGATSVISGTYPSNHKAGADKGEVAICRQARRLDHAFRERKLLRHDRASTPRRSEGRRES